MSENILAGTNIVFPECIICLSPLQSNLVTPINCGHVFHEDCLKNWRNKGNNDKCPVCKRDCSHSIKLIFEIKYCSLDNLKEEPQTCNELIMRNRILKNRNEKYEEEIKELTEYNNKCQKTVEDFIKRVEENTKNMAKYKNEYLTVKCLLDEEKEKNQKHMDTIDKLTQEKTALENFKKRFELKSEIDTETDKILLKDSEKAQEEFETQFYKLLNDDDENKGLREYFYVLQQKILKLTKENEDLKKEKKNNYYGGYNSGNATYVHLMQLSSNTEKRNYREYMNEHKIIDNKNKINTSDDKKSLSDSNTDNYNIKKNDINNEINVIVNTDNKRPINAIRLKNNNNESESRKLFLNPFKNNKTLTFKKNK